jgi:hypothetical protein
MVFEREEIRGIPSFVIASPRNEFHRAPRDAPRQLFVAWDKEREMSRRLSAVAIQPLDRLGALSWSKRLAGLLRRSAPRNDMEWE